MNDFLHIPNLSGLVTDLQPDSIISRTIHNDSDVKIILFAFAPGQALSEHTSAHKAILHVFYGEAEITIRDSSETAAPGAWFYLPAEIPHSVNAHTEMHMLLYLIKSGD